LRVVREKWNLPILVSTHPRTRKSLDSLGIKELEGVVFHEPFGYLDYNKLQIGAKCVISDSGTISEESAIIGFPAISLRDSIERPESLDSGSIILSGLDPENLLTALDITLSLPRALEQPDGYESLDFSTRVLSFVVSTASKHYLWSGIRTQTSGQAAKEPETR
jgi:UDP-N-acetylglucosamine 2-epimerase (non-hydrolysing)